jgi:hypothetical protein
MQKYKDNMKAEVEKKAAIVEQGKKSIGFSK